MYIKRLFEFLKCLKSYQKAIIIILISFLIFFWRFYDAKQLLIGTQTTDLLSMHYPFHSYLFEKLTQEHLFPFWTERLHGGFPLYADLEKGFLSPINIFLTLLLGPINSVYATYFIFYFAGAIGLYLLLNKYKITLSEWLPAHFIYFFSFFHTLRLQLLNSVTISFTLPLNLFFIKQFAETKQARWIVFCNLLNAINFEYGQLNYLFLSVAAQVLFMGILLAHRSKSSFINLIKTLVFFSLTLLTMTLHGIIPAGRLFMLGDRSSGVVSYLEGSISPATFLVTIYPYIFGNAENYVGKEIDHSYYINEIYVYTGIVAFIFALVGIMKIKDKRLLAFVMILISVFVVLATIKYIPILNSLNFPPLSLFRFWIRSSVYFVFCISILVSFGLHLLNEKTYFKRIGFIGLLGAFLVAIELISGITYTTRLMITNFLHGSIARNSSFYIWLILLLLSCILILLSRKYGSSIKQLTICLIIFETIFFGLKNISSAFAPRQYYFNFTPVDVNFENARIVNSNQKEFYGNTHLYYKSWSLFGYSGPFESKKYGDYLRSSEFLSTRRTKVDINTIESVGSYLYLLKNLGVHRIYNDIFEYVDVPLNKKNIDLVITRGTTSSYTLKQEGHLQYTITNPTTDTIEVQTAVKNYYGWKTKIDGKKINFPSDTLFIKFLLEPGTHTVDMRFIPIDFIYGLLATIILAAFIPLIHKFTKLK